MIPNQYKHHQAHNDDWSENLDAEEADMIAIEEFRDNLVKMNIENFTFE